MLEVRPIHRPRRAGTESAEIGVEMAARECSGRRDAQRACSGTDLESTEARSFSAERTLNREIIRTEGN